jgi:DNA-directed RNA polymerase subunit L
MEFKFVEQKKDVIELEFDEKETPMALVGVLSNSGVDAYGYEPHPLIKGFRVHIEADDAKAELKKAVDSLDTQWSQFKKAVTAKLK